MTQHNLTWHLHSQEHFLSIHYRHSQPPSQAKPTRRQPTTPPTTPPGPAPDFTTNMGGRRGKRPHHSPSSPRPPADPTTIPHKPAARAALTSQSHSGPPPFPRKKFYRQRAHANPFSDHALAYPPGPAAMDWRPLFPAYADAAGRLAAPVAVADVGCGFGGLLFALARVAPGRLTLGLEIRTAVTEFVEAKVRAARSVAAREGAGAAVRAVREADAADGEGEGEVGEGAGSTFGEIAALRTNAMKFLVNLLPKGGLRQMYLCFPDPHFKARKHKARITSPTLLAEYAYVLRPGGLVLTITDVEDLAGWMARHFDGHASFERVAEEALEGSDAECVRVMREETEEGRKVTRNGGKKFVGIWRRRPDPEWLAVEEDEDEAMDN